MESQTFAPNAELAPNEPVADTVSAPQTQPMNVRECIPEDKHDLPAIERARASGFPSLNVILPDLLEWLQDATWPVAHPTASVLSKAGLEITPHIKEILASEDSIWKYWLVELLVVNLTPEVLSELRNDLLRLADQPTRNDKLEQVDILAQRVLATK